MSNAKTTEAVTDLQRQYTKAALELGTLVYQNSAMQANIEQNETAILRLTRNMKKLALKADELQGNSNDDGEIDLSAVVASKVAGA